MADDAKKRSKSSSKASSRTSAKKAPQKRAAKKRAARDLDDDAADDTTEQRNGRPPKYSPEFDKWALKAAMLEGATNDDLGRFFDVSSKTIERWMKRYPSFRENVLNGRAFADANVAARGYQLAMGWSHRETRTAFNAKRGRWESIEVTQHFPPDQRAVRYWLNNRRPDKWRDKPREEDQAPMGEEERVRRMTDLFNQMDSSISAPVDDSPGEVRGEANDSASETH